MKQFPVLWQGGMKYLKELHLLDCPRTIPWALIEEHAEWCKVNHGQQTPEVLAERGGLAPAEIVAVVRHTKTWVERQAVWALSVSDEVKQLKEIVAEFTARTAPGSGT